MARISKIHVGQSAKFAFFYYLLIMAVVMAPMLLLMLIFGATFSGEENATMPRLGMGMGIGMLIFLVPIYAGLGAVMVALGSWLYNVVAKKIGGIEIDVA